MLWIHILSGSLAIVTGFIALYARKGGATHVSAGRVFSMAMIVMTLSAALVAALIRPNLGNVIAATTTLYLVITGWLAVRSDPERARRSHLALATAALGLGIYNVFVFELFWQLPGRALDGIPALAVLMFATVLLLGAIGDLRLLGRGSLPRAQRTLRHLWRMTFAMWVATMSLFLGQADEFPALVRSSGVLFVPVLAVTATLLYWGLRQSWIVVRSQRRPAAVAAQANPAR